MSMRLFGTRILISIIVEICFYIFPILRSSAVKENLMHLVDLWPVVYREEFVTCCLCSFTRKYK